MRQKAKAVTTLAGCLLLAACGTITVVSTPRPTTTAPASPSPAGSGSDGDVVMCTLMPLGDVQAKSPFQTALAEFEEGAVPGMCEYRSADDAEEPVGILLVVTQFATGADASTSLANQRQAAVDSGILISDIDGVGDKAFSSGSDEVGVHATLGKLLIDANLSGEWPDTTDDAKVAAGTELIRTIISRLP